MSFLFAEASVGYGNLETPYMTISEVTVHTPPNLSLW